MLVEKEYLKDRMQEVEESIQELQRVCSAPFEQLSIDKKYTGAPLEHLLQVCC